MYNSCVLLQNYLDHNRDHDYLCVRLSMSRHSKTVPEPTCKNDNDDVISKTCRVFRCHRLQPERLQVYIHTRTLKNRNVSLIVLANNDQTKMYETL